MAGLASGCASGTAWWICPCSRIACPETRHPPWRSRHSMGSSHWAGRCGRRRGARCRRCWWTTRARRPTTTSPRSGWFGPSIRATTWTSIHRWNMPPISGRCSVRTGTPFFPTGGICPLVITAGPAASWSAAPRSAARTGRPAAAMTIRWKARPGPSTSSWRWDSSPGRAMTWGHRSPSTTPVTTSSAWCWSTTGAPATSSAGSTSRWARSSASRSPRRYRPGW